MAMQGLFRRTTFKSYLLVLCVLYLMMVFLFHSDLQDSRTTSPRGVTHSRPPTGSPRTPQGPAKVEAIGGGILAANGRVTDRVQAMPGQKQAQEETGLRAGVKAPQGQAQVQAPRHSWDAEREPRDCLGLDNGREFEFLEVVREKLFVFSAYWDHRPNDFDNKHNGSYIRIISAFHWYGQKPDISCTFTLESGSTTNTKASYYEMCENHGRPIGGFILSCKVPTEIWGQPCSVTVSENNGALPGQVLKVMSIDPSPERNQFAICVPPIFGDVNHYKLVEFIEMSMLLGAERVNFYDFQVSKPVQDVLKHYQSEKKVSVIPWNFPEQLDKKTWYHGQLISIQDCLYRNMRTAEYLAFNDIDEFIVPHMHADWSEMMAAMFKPKSQCAFQFHSAFFERGRDKPQLDDDAGLFTMTNTWRSSHFSQIRTKCMVKPYLIFEKGIHHVSKPIWATLDVTRMPESVSFLHHYRTCMRDFGMNCDSHQNDTYLDKFSGTLERRVQQVLQTVA